jgi:hypothetical protein
MNIEAKKLPGREWLTRPKSKEPPVNPVNPNSSKPRLGLSGVKAAADIDRSKAKVNS